ncbi:MAG TPA: hypothetical protein VIC33_11160 [Vicinamibacterales bacterium]|jgi:hypothetical protein
MPHVVVNEGEQTLEKLPETWGKLLAGVDRDAAARGEVVTAVRFDGVDEPTFRQPAHAALPLTGFERIEIETTPPSELIDEALAQGALSLAALSAAAAQTGDAFRGVDLAGANQGLMELAEGVRSMVAILATGAQALGVDLQQMTRDGRSVAAQITELSGQLESIIDAQQAHDWLTVADILEYDLEPALKRWRPIFDTLRASVRPAA